MAENKRSNNANKVPIWEKSNLTIREAAEYSNIGINRIEELQRCRIANLYYMWERRNS